MKKLVALVFLFLARYGVFAQPYIDASWVPVPGDNFVIQKADFSQLPFTISGDTGADTHGNNLTWDFNQLQSLSNFDTVRYSGKPDTIIRTENGDVKILSWDSNNLVRDIYSGGCGFLSGNGIFYHFPMADSGIISTTVSESWGGNYGRVIDQFEYRGWGTLILPGNIRYDSAIAIRQTSDDGCQTIIQQDGYLIQEYVTGEIITSTQWVVRDISEPVLIINSTAGYRLDWQISNGQATGVTRTDYPPQTSVFTYANNFYTGITALGFNDNWHLFPNPANDRMHINFDVVDHDAKQVRIYDTMGKLVTEQSYAPDIDIRFLTPGIYLLELRGREGRSLKKFAKL